MNSLHYDSLFYIVIYYRPERISITQEHVGSRVGLFELMHSRRYDISSAVIVIYNYISADRDERDLDSSIDTFFAVPAAACFAIAIRK